MKVKLMSASRVIEALEVTISSCRGISPRSDYNDGIIEGYSSALRYVKALTVDATPEPNHSGRCWNCGVITFSEIPFNVEIARMILNIENLADAKVAQRKFNEWMESES